MHMKFFMNVMNYLWKKFLIEFNLFMQVNFMKELETSFWHFVHKLFEEIIIWYLCYITDISTLVQYKLFIFMV